MLRAKALEADQCEGGREDVCLRDGVQDLCYTGSISQKCECMAGYFPLMTQVDLLRVSWICCPGEVQCRLKVFHFREK